MQINSLDDAINLTMQKYNYQEESRKKIYEELEKGNFAVITSDRGARAFVEKHYANLEAKRQQNKMVYAFSDFASLTTYFNQILQSYNIGKEDMKSIHLLYQDLANQIMNPNCRQDIERLLVEAATSYNRENQNKQPMRKYDFYTQDLTRDEACEITSIFGNMEHQKQQVTTALNRSELYRQLLLDNLIRYSYYENDYSKSLAESVNESKTK